MRSLSKRPVYRCVGLCVSLIGLLSLVAAPIVDVRHCAVIAFVVLAVGVPSFNQDRTAAALALSGTGLWHRDTAKQGFEFDDVSAMMLGIGEARSLTLEAFLAQIATSDRPQVIEAMNSAAFNASAIDVEFQHSCSGGATRNVRLRGGAIKCGQLGSTELAGTLEDVTSEVRTRAALLERDSLYERIAENVPGVVYQMVRFPDGSRQVPFISQRVDDIFGYTREQVYANANILIDAIHPEDRVEKEDLALASMRDLVKFDWTGRILRPDGKERWIHALCVPARLASGAILWDGVILDVTEIKQAEIELLETKDRLAWLMRSSPVVLYSCEGKSPFPITYLSDNSDELLGIPVSDCLEDPQYWQSRVHPDEAELALEALTDVCTSGQAAIEYRIRVPSGEYRWIRDEMRYVAEGNAIVGTVVDVTDRRQAQEAQRVSDERFLAMSNASPLGVFLTDPQGEMLYANAKLSEISGLEPGDLTGRRLLALVHDDDVERILAAYDDSVSGREGFSVQCRLRRKDNSTIWSSIKSSPMMDQGRLLGFVGTVEDVTERFELELQSEQSRIEAEKANQAKSVFLSRISHELRTPLHAMLGFAQLLRMEQLTDQQSESVDNILGSGHHLLSLIRDVLDIARAESGELGVQVTTVSLYPVVEEAVQMLAALAREKAVSIETKFVDGDHVSVLADRQRLRQALINVLSNAIKYNRREGNVTIGCSVRPDGYAVLSVRDSGQGIPSDKVDRLFTPFDRLGAEASEIEGTGLGLTLTKRLIEAMEGRLELTSDPRTGTSVEIELRCAGSRQAGYALVEPLPFQKAVKSGSMKVLLVEDNEVNQKLMEQVFSNRSDYRLWCSKTGREGIDAALQIEPDIVLLDMNLPDVHGLALIERIKREPALAHTVVIVTSAVADERSVERAHKAGADAYLTKPLHIGELFATIDQELGARQK
jgi:PAS domain S-box-containing protein